MAWKISHRDERQFLFWTYIISQGLMIFFKLAILFYRCHNIAISDVVTYIQFGI